MVTRDDIVGFVRQPCIKQLQKLHEKGLTEHEKFHKHKQQLPKIDLRSEVVPGQTKRQKRVNRLTTEDSTFIIQHTEYWDLYTNLDTTLLAFNVTITDELAHYVLTKETARIQGYITQGDYDNAFQAIIRLYGVIHGLLLVRDFEATGLAYTNCLITAEDLQTVVEGIGFSNHEVPVKGLTAPTMGVERKFNGHDRQQLERVTELITELHTPFSTNLATEMTTLIHVLQGYESTTHTYI